MSKTTAKRADTVAEFVTSFGGTSAMAEFLDVGMPCVSNWKRENFIPSGWHLRLFLEAQRRQIAVAPDLFGIAEPVTEPPCPRAKGNGHAAAA